nr:hypothetical protein Itr_chr15CG06080 [Ipomoea trifida]
MRREGAEGAMEFKTGFGATMKEDFKEVCSKCLEDAIITRRLFNLQLQLLKLYEKSPPREFNMVTSFLGWGYLGFKT